jgi:hypothetical protein
MRRQRHKLLPQFTAKGEGETIPMTTPAGKTIVHTGSHWGVYDVEVEQGRVVGVRAFAKDPKPSGIIDTMPSAVHAASRIERPMVRQGWLKHGVGSNRFLETYTVGFERLRAYLLGETDGTPKDADWAAHITQIPASTIRTLSRRDGPRPYDDRRQLVGAARRSR